MEVTIHTTRNTLPLILSLALLLASCGGGAGSTTPGGGADTPGPIVTPAPGATAYTMSGTVRNSAGEPLAGARVFAGHTVYYNTNALGTSGADGRYSVSVREPAGSWYAGAQITRRYNGVEYTFDLQPDNTEPFTGAQGAVRNFTWRLTGDRPDGHKYGATVAVYADFFDPELLDWIPDIELTLTPDGPLIDGSAGQVIRKRLGQTPEGDGIEDIPLGTYRVTARYAPSGAAPRDLGVRVRNQGQFAPNVVSAFQQNGSGHLLEVEVSRR